MNTPPEMPTEAELREGLLKLDRSILELTRLLGDAIAVLEQSRELYQQAVERGECAEALARQQRGIAFSESQVQQATEMIQTRREWRDRQFKFLRRNGIEL